MDGSAIEWTTDFVLSTLARGAPFDAASLTLLLRRYCVTGRADVGDALEPALAWALERHTDAQSTEECAAWLALFAEAVALTDDERIGRAVSDLVERLRVDWGRPTAVEAAAVGVDACLACCHLPEVRAFASDAVDELERIVAGVYTPGDGLAARVNDRSGVRGRLADHVRLASALLTAFDRTGRLPYSMLAEELIQWSRRVTWDEAAGLFLTSPAERSHPFALNCDAARVLRRLAALHEQEAYRQAAVLASDADYARDGRRILTALAESYQRQGLMSAAYGLALAEWLA